MKKIVKIAGIALAVVLAILIVVPMAFTGKIGGIVKTEANKMLDARLDFDKLNISLLRHFPHASLELKGLTLVGTGQFEGDTIVAADRISVVVNVMSLFGDSGFEVTKVVLARPAVHAHKLADGAVNWDVMKASDEEAAEPAEETSDGASSFRLSIRDVRIDGAEIRYLDDSTRLAFVTEPLDLRLSGDLSADRTDLALNLKASQTYLRMGEVTMLNGAEAELDAVIAADLKTNRFTFTENTLRLNAIRMTLDGWVALAGERIDLDLKAGCEEVKFKDILSMIPAFYTRDFKNLTAGGEMSLTAWAKGSMIGNRLPAFEVKLGVKDGSFKYAALPKSVSAINVAARVANPGGVMDQTVVEVSKFGLSMAGNSLGATFYASNLVSDPSFRASAVGRVDLGAIDQVYPLGDDTTLEGMITADLKVAAVMSDIEKQHYEKINASGTFTVEGMNATVEGLPEVKIRRAAATITPSAMTLGELGVTIGGSDLAAKGQLSNYIGYFLKDDTLSGRLYLTSKLLDLNELLGCVPESAEEEASAEAAPADAEPAAEQGVVEVPRNLALSLNATVDKILFQQMTITDFAGDLKVANGTLDMSKLAMKAFGGSMSASGSYSTAANPLRPALKLALNIDRASFEKTFAELDMVRQIVPIFAKTGGDYSMKLDMRTSLDEHMSPDLMSLNATGFIRSANIRVQNIGAFDALAKALKNDALRKIEAKDVAIEFAIADGRVTTKPFDLKVGGTSVRLSGTTGLDQTIDYTAKVALPGAAGGVLESVNVGIGGTFTSPKITLGVKDAVENVVKSAVHEQIGKLTGGSDLGEEVGRQAEKLRSEAAKAGEKLVEAAKAQKVKLVDAAKNPLAKIAAEKAGNALVKEAEKQAENLKAEAEAQIAALQEKMTPKSE